MPADRLIDELWGDEPPATGQATLHVYLSGLRKILGDRLQRISGGYSVRVDEGELDATYFTRLTTRTSQIGQDPAEISARLGGRWRCGVANH